MPVTPAIILPSLLKSAPLPVLLQRIHSRLRYLAFSPPLLSYLISCRLNAAVYHMDTCSLLTRQFVLYDIKQQLLLPPRLYSHAPPLIYYRCSDTPGRRLLFGIYLSATRLTLESDENTSDRNIGDLLV
jgi:hypothetical protein